MLRPADPRDYQSCRDRLAVALSEIEYYEISGYPVLASISRREARRLHQLSQWLPKSSAQCV